MLQIGQFFSQRVLLVFLRQKNIVFTSLDFIHSFNLILIFLNLLSPIVSLFITAAHGVKNHLKNQVCRKSSCSSMGNPSSRSKDTENVFSLDFWPISEF